MEFREKLMSQSRAFLLLIFAFRPINHLNDLGSLNYWFRYIIIIDQNNHEQILLLFPYFYTLLSFEVKKFMFQYHNFFLDYLLFILLRNHQFL